MRARWKGSPPRRGAWGSCPKGCSRFTTWAAGRARVLRLPPVSSPEGRWRRGRRSFFSSPLWRGSALQPQGRRRRVLPGVSAGTLSANEDGAPSSALGQAASLRTRCTAEPHGPFREYAGARAALYPAWESAHQAASQDVLTRCNWRTHWRTRPVNGVVEPNLSRLENRWACKRPLGSNPSPAALAKRRLVPVRVRVEGRIRRGSTGTLYRTPESPLQPVRFLPEPLAGEVDVPARRRAGRVGPRETSAPRAESRPRQRS